MIYIAIGGNLPSARFGPPPASLDAALERLAGRDIAVCARSRWYRSAPLPPSAQPDYINGVAAVQCALRPALLLAVLHEIESEFGRARREENEARCLDLDLLAYDELVVGDESALLRLPHPRLAQRAFVLAPWAELAADWRHPLSGLTVKEMLAALPDDQQIDVLQQ